MEFNKASEMLEAWDKNEIVTTVERGGIGPGYEQTIQVLTMEIVRDALKKRKRWKNEHIGSFETLAGGTINRLNSEHGFSGAQVGMARDLAFRYLRDGHAGTIADARKQLGDDCTILISKQFAGAA